MRWNSTTCWRSKGQQEEVERKEKQSRYGVHDRSADRCVAAQRDYNKSAEYRHALLETERRGTTHAHKHAWMYAQTILRATMLLLSKANGLEIGPSLLFAR